MGKGGGAGRRTVWQSGEKTRAHRPCRPQLGQRAEFVDALQHGQASAASQRPQVRARSQPAVPSPELDQGGAARSSQALEGAQVAVAFQVQLDQAAAASQCPQRAWAQAAAPSPQLDQGGAARSSQALEGAQVAVAVQVQLGQAGAAGKPLQQARAQPAVSSKQLDQGGAARGRQPLERAQRLRIAQVQLGQAGATHAVECARPQAAVVCAQSLHAGPGG